MAAGDVLDALASRPGRRIFRTHGGLQMIDFSVFQVPRDFPSFLCSLFAAAADLGIVVRLGLAAEWGAPSLGPLALLLRRSLWFYCLTSERSFLALVLWTFGPDDPLPWGLPCAR